MRRRNKPQNLLTPLKPQRASATRGNPNPWDPEALRLFVCNRCKVIEELPTYSGSNPAIPSTGDGDLLLSDTVARHAHGQSAAVINQAVKSDWRVGTVWRSDWQDPESRREIIEAIRKSEGHTGLGDDFYASRDTYREEAVKCFNRHRRPDVATGCPDYQAHAKLLGNTLVTDEERNELNWEQRRNLSDSRSKIWLCNFCPYHTMVIHTIRERND